MSSRGGSRTARKCMFSVKIHVGRGLSPAVRDGIDGLRRSTMSSRGGSRTARKCAFSVKIHVGRGAPAIREVLPKEE